MEYNCRMIYMNPFCVILLKQGPVVSGYVAVFLGQSRCLSSFVDSTDRTANNEPTFLGVFGFLCFTCFHLFPVLFVPYVLARKAWLSCCAGPSRLLFIYQSSIQMKQWATIHDRKRSYFDLFPLRASSICSNIDFLLLGGLFLRLLP